MADKKVIGNSELWNGDCREILPLLPPVDLILTDPPYGIKADKGMGDGGKDSTGRWARSPRRYDGKWDSTRPTANEFNMILAAGKKSIIWGGNHFADLLPKCGRWLFWDKLNSMPTYSDGEIAWTNLKGNTIKIFRQCNNGMASKRDGERIHPTQKPVSLIRWCMTFVPDARTVCDPFMGSGTTGFVCAQMGLKFIGIERERSFFEAAYHRINNVYQTEQLLR